jgi:ElaB/YqjD/DUF883 family membrane-anchored ribosome-binding protein
MNAGKIKGAAKNAASSVESAAGDIGADINHRIDELSGLANRSFGEAVEMGEEAVAKVRDFVEQDPWKAVVIAGAVGLLVGLAARR